MAEAEHGYVFRWCDYHYGQAELEGDFQPLPIIEMTPDLIVIEDHGRMISIPRSRFETDGFWAPPHEQWRRYYPMKPEPKPQP